MPFEHQKLTDRITALVKRLVTEIILHPEDLQVASLLMSNTATISIVAHAGDVGRIIGTKAHRHNALYYLCKMAGQRHGLTVVLASVSEPMGRPSRDRCPVFTSDPNWPRKRIESLLSDWAALVVDDSEAVRIQHEARGTISAFRIVVASTENQGVTDALSLAFATLFKVVGMANGRTILAEMIRGEGSSERQPESARGRFTKEIER